MAETAVSFLVDKLTSLLGEEAKLLGRIRGEVASVNDELQSMKAFLQKADAVEDEDPEIKAWVKQVREVAYDTEDIIDEFLYRFEHPRRPGCYGQLCKVARFIKTLKARRRIASELQTVKPRVTNVSQRHERYGNILNILERGSTSSLATNYIDRPELRRTDARFLHENQLFGIDQPKLELARWLLDDAISNSQVTAVVGMGGLGKTTLVNQVYKDAEVEQYFPHRAWITVSQRYILRDLLEEIIKQLFKGISEPVPNDISSKDILSLKEEIINFLGEKKYLVVLDDLWSVDSWDDLKYAFPIDNDRGSRLIVTTRNSDVANTTTRDVFGGNIFRLEALSPKESWNLFCARTFRGSPCPHHLESICENILKRCAGLPLAIVAISGVLATKDSSNINQWKIISDHLGPGLDNSDRIKNMKKILSLSFDDLPYQLKSCFLYLSLFPEDWLLYKEHTIELWLANDFVEERENTTLEEVAEIYFNELCNRSLIQVVQEGISEKLNAFKVHDLFRKIILQKSFDQNLAAIAREQNLLLPESVRHLSMLTKLENLQRSQCKFSRLRTLIFLNTDVTISSFSMSEFFRKHGGLRLLKALDCCELPLDTFPDCITKLYNLRYLSLHGTYMASLPSSIGRLRSLETLNLGDTLIEELPVDIIQLSRLRKIIIFHYVNDVSAVRKIGATVPIEIGKLTSLQFLCKIKASHGSVDLLRSLEDLVQLRDLHLQQLGIEHGPALCSLIEKLNRLRNLSLETREEDEKLDVQNISSPPQCLQELNMFGRLEMLPNWLPKLSSLVVLHLRCSKLQLDPLESLQALPNLQHLEFEKAYDGEELCVKAGGFQMLKRLGFCSLDRLRKVIVEQGAMPCLQSLRFEDCKALEGVPSGVEFLTHLKEFAFIRMDDELLKKIESELPRLKHVPKITAVSRGRLRIAIKLQMDNRDQITRAMKIAAASLGVDSIMLSGDQLIVIGSGIDAASLVRSVQEKSRFANLQGMGR